MNAAQLLEHFDRLSEAPGAVARLRRFILDLAVRGKLVAQEAGDEPAGELLKRIRAERLRVLMKKPVKSNVTADTELDSTDIELPAGWAWSKLGDLCTKTGSGSTPSGGKDAYIASGVPFLRSQNVYDDGLRLEGVAFISDATQERMSSTTVKAGDLLLNITGGSIGRCAIVPDTFVIGNINQHVAIIRLALIESGRFLHSVICSDYFQRHIFGNQTGAGREGLPKNRMDEILIPIPPLAEQHRIVAKVDELMALCNQLEAAQQERERRRDRLADASLQRLNQPAADTTPEAQREHARFHLLHLPRLTTRPEHIKAMRETFRGLAVRGRLISQDITNQSATHLVKKILDEIGKLIKDGEIRKQSKQDVIATTELPFELPAGWAWVRLGDVINLVSGQHLQPGEYSSKMDAGIPYITGPADFGDKHLRITRYAVVRKAVATEGQILLTVKGSGVGKTTICDLPEVAISRQLMSMTAIGWSQSFLLLVTHRLAETLKGSARSLIPGIAREDVNQFVVALPPLAEQHRIVAKVDELMTLCDQLEAQLTTTQIDSSRFLEAVLEAAFVPV